MLARQFEYCFNRRHTELARAPGRVNLIGEHTDYNEGFVFPAAINFATQVLAAPRDDREINVVALDLGGERNRFSLDAITFDRTMPWSNYVRGVLQCLQQEVGALQGLDILVTGNVPQGAGLSSSASFEMALLKAVSDVYSLGLDGVAAAKIGQRAENEFVGCSCGIMDQLISAKGRKDHAMLLDCRTLEIFYTPLASELQIVIINSNVKRGLVDSEYNMRRQQCESAARTLGAQSLRELDMTQLENGRAQLSDTEYRRARHVVTENERTEQMFNALKGNDLPTVSRLMSESHASMRDDFEITVEPIDQLVTLAQSVIGESGGARMTGGGFGGCVVALCPVGAVEELKRVVQQHYYARTGLRENVYCCSAQDGAFSL